MATLPWIVENAPTFSIFRSALNLRLKTNCTVVRSNDAVRGLAKTLDRVLLSLLLLLLEHLLRWSNENSREAVQSGDQPVGKMDVFQPRGKPVRTYGTRRSISAIDRFDFAPSRNRVRISDRMEWDGMGWNGMERDRNETKRNETKRNGTRAVGWARGGKKIVAPRDRKMEDYRGKGGREEGRRASRGHRVE